MPSEFEGIKAFNAHRAFYVNMFGIGLVSPSIHEIMPEEGRPAYTIGAQGWRGNAWGQTSDEQWIASWQTMAVLHGSLDALRAELPEPFRPMYAQIRRETMPTVRQSFIDIAEVFRREAGS